MKFTDKQKTALLVIGFGGAVLMVLVLYFQFVFNKQQMSDMNRRKDRAERELTNLRKELATINAILAERELMERQMEVLKQITRRLPQTVDAPGFLTALINSLRATGLLQQSVEPLKPVDRSLYTEIPWDIIGFGRYHELGQFLTLIEQNPDRFMRVRQMVVDNSLQRPSIHPLRLQISTFMFTR